MEVLIPDEIRKDPVLASSVNAISEYLGKDFKSSVMNPTARWEMRRDLKGSPLLELEIADRPEVVSQTFTPAELADSWGMYWRLSSLWKQLLSRRGERERLRFAELLREVDEKSGV